jgi:hypothetical protein
LKVRLPPSSANSMSVTRLSCRDGPSLPQRTLQADGIFNVHQRCGSNFHFSIIYGFRPYGENTDAVVAAIAPDVSRPP